jgi:hypothetical protein
LQGLTSYAVASEIIEPQSDRTVSASAGADAPCRTLEFHSAPTNPSSGTFALPARDVHDEFHPVRAIGLAKTSTGKAHTLAEGTRKAENEDPQRRQARRTKLQVQAMAVAQSWLELQGLFRRHCEE